MTCFLLISEIKVVTDNFLLIIIVLTKKTVTKSVMHNGPIGRKSQFECSILKSNDGKIGWIENLLCTKRFSILNSLPKKVVKITRSDIASYT